MLYLLEPVRRNYQDSPPQVVAQSLRRELKDKIDSDVGSAEGKADENLRLVQASLGSKVAGESAIRIEALRQELTSKMDSDIGESFGRADSDLRLVQALLNSNIVEETSRRGQALRQELESLIDNGLGESDAKAESALRRVQAILNDRIGIVYTTQTTDATPTVIATLTPTPNTSMRIDAKIVAHRTDRLEAAIYRLQALARPEPASEILTSTGVNPANGDQVKIDAKTYTFQTVLTDADGNVQIGASASASLDNLVAAINLTGTPGTDYAASMTKHPTASASKASATTMEAVALDTGTAGNSITTTTPVGVQLSWGAGTMSGGTNMTIFGANLDVDHEDDAAWNVSIAANGSDAEISVTGVADTSIEWKISIETFDIYLA